MGRNFDRSVRAQLCVGADGERFSLPEASRPILVAALERDLAEPDPSESMLAALRLAAAFDGALASPSLAALIRSILMSSSAAIAAVRGIQKQKGGLDVTRRFARREGREIILHAPSVSAKTPRGAIPLRALFDVGGARPRSHRKA